MKKIIIVGYVLLVLVAWKSKDWHISNVLDGSKKQWMQRVGK